MKPTRPEGRDDGGQASVEAALVLPFVILLLLAVVQVGLLVRAEVLVTHVAREGARVAAVDADPAHVEQAAHAATTLDSSRLTISVTGGGGRGSRVLVRATYRAATDVPLVGALLGDLDLTSQATMRVE